MRQLLTLRSPAWLPAIAALALLLCCSSALLTTRASAQCPTCSCPPPPLDDAQYDTTPIPWSDSSICALVAVDRYGDSCYVKFCYIYRQTSSTNYDYALTAVCVDPGCPYTADSSVLLPELSWWLMQNNPQHFPANPCPTAPDSNSCGMHVPGPYACCGNDIQWNENFLNCWAYCTKNYWTACPTHGWCIDAYWVCKKNDGTIRFCYDRSVHTTWQCEPGGQPSPCNPSAWGTPPCTPQGRYGTSQCPDWMH